ncbi:MAG: beta/gamma crystallin-related protein [Mucilaginibacter sp.]|uniref:beta/gamma crystallin-related protein n=1 Tax=Mucilaginibacter sp. TaxID=1882438 RepID=UPI0035676172
MQLPATDTSPETSPLLCHVKTLPQELWAEAAALAVKINPANAASPHRLKQAFPNATPPHSFLVMSTSKYWGSNGVHLRVRFLNNPAADLKARILDHLNAWSVYANILFSESNDEPQVRINLDGPPDYWSYVGTDILLIDKTLPTMNLGGFTMNTSEAEFRRVVRHEAGHTLGFQHEHQRAEIINKIDPAKAIAYYAAPPNNWDEKTTRSNILTALDPAGLRATAQPDIVSIMCYNLPGGIMKDGIAVTGGVDIDQKDGEFAIEVYNRIKHHKFTVLLGDKQYVSRIVQDGTTQVALLDAIQVKLVDLIDRPIPDVEIIFDPYDNIDHPSVYFTTEKKPSSLFHIKTDANGIATLNGYNGHAAMITTDKKAKIVAVLGQYEYVEIDYEVGPLLYPVVYEDFNFLGRYQELKRKLNYLNDLSVVGNDTISSIRVPYGFCVTLYADDLLKGKSHTYISDEPYMFDFNDLTSSIIVKRVAFFYSDRDYKGTSMYLTEGNWNDNHLSPVGNDNLSSVRVPKGVKVTLYEDANYQGKSRTLTDDCPYLEGFNDIVSSIRVESN